MLFHCLTFLARISYNILITTEMSRNAEIAVVLSASSSSFFKPMLYLEGISSKTSFGKGTNEIILVFDG